MWKRIHLLHCTVKQIGYLNIACGNPFICYIVWLKHSIVLFKAVRNIYLRFVRLG